jgi:hypothetical protein
MWTARQDLRFSLRQLIKESRIGPGNTSVNASRLIGSSPGGECGRARNQQAKGGCVWPSELTLADEFDANTRSNELDPEIQNR